ncbi:MAG: YraN family protein [Alphaproteobacteria bacterium]|nr:YraN family protein [Alphaproteobacteria bacterium]
MRSKTSYSTGLWAEFIARWYLRIHGFRILHNRYVTGRNTRRAEIDIIARRDNLIVFVEVKRRKTLQCACDAITPTQVARLRRAAETYLGRIRWRGDARFDIIAICGMRVHWIKNGI